MFMFHSSELINYNLLPILIGLFFKTSMVSIYNIHFLLSRIPKIMTTSLYQAIKEFFSVLPRAIIIIH